MYWLVESKKQLREFYDKDYKNVFVEIIPYNNRIHPTQNDVCAVYIQPLNSPKGFIIPICHSETLLIDINDVKHVLNTFENVYVRDKKEFLHYFILKTLHDITLNSPPYIQQFTTTHSFFYNKMGDKKDLNRIIPIVKHYEYCEQTFNDLKKRINEPINEFFNTKATVVFNAIERAGLRVNRDEFQSRFHDIDGEYVHTQFNFKTLTGRPSNRFKGVNYAAINKENGDRKVIIPRNDFLIELDISAYHPTLLANLVGFTFGSGDIHMAFAEMYKVDYKKAKELTFRQMYGGAFDQYKDLEFFKKLGVYTDEMWERYQAEGFIECPLSNYRFERDELEDMNPPKLLNYILQSTETANNVLILWDMFKILRGAKTKLILYTYDSFCFDVDKTERDKMKEIMDIFPKYDLRIKMVSGDNYHDMV